MCKPKEAAQQPLCSRIPKMQALGAVLMYPLAYLYVRAVLFPHDYPGWGMPVFAVLFMLYTEIAARSVGRTAAQETPLWAVCWLALSVALPLFGYQPEPLGLWQGMVWHLFAVWYVLARCGMLAQGFSGSLVFLDALAGLIRLPFGNFFLRARTVLTALRSRLQRRTGGRKVLRGVGTALLTLVLCAVAWGLLAAADANFAALGQRVSDWWNDLLNNIKFVDTMMYLLFSLPVGAWLYGLVGGSLRRETPPVTAAQWDAALTKQRFLPRTTATIAVGALCGVYALFFTVQAGEWLAAAPLGLRAPDAAAFAVAGFWELLQILLLDFAVLAGVHFLGRGPLPKGLAALFCGFGTAFAGLTWAKLVVYIALYGFTPRRVTAGWFLAVLTVWTILALVRVFRIFPAARIAVAVLALSFTLLSCVDMKQRIIEANLARYASGQDAELDWDVLWECGYPET